MTEQCLQYLISSHISSNDVVSSKIVATVASLLFLLFLSWVWSMFNGTIVDIELSVLTRPLHFLEGISITNRTFLASVRLRNVKIHVKIKSVKLVKIWKIKISSSQTK